MNERDGIGMGSSGGEVMKGIATEVHDNSESSQYCTVSPTEHFRDILLSEFIHV